MDSKWILGFHGSKKGAVRRTDGSLLVTMTREGSVDYFAARHASICS